MKVIKSEKKIKIVRGANVSVRSRVVTVTGPRGTLVRSFKHIQCDIRVVGKYIHVEIWLGQKLHRCSVGTIIGHLKNMMLGVTAGFHYKLRLVFAHFPMIFKIDEENRIVTIDKYLGGIGQKRVPIPDGVTVVRDEEQKESFDVFGNNIEDVSQFCARVSQSTQTRDKDIRKFLDGVYVIEKGTIGDIKPVV
eukprot:TRINITY_DN13412_c0_g1_i1.p1 TRINITY_DN13412_c0_g1~~TRINITY_DN13412_c0_g1_i1.p1  ORF type:complete len:192 (+),score=43.43 TRINITY_DN13412_c0_g1_i1:33-608(+)